MSPEAKRFVCVADPGGILWKSVDEGWMSFEITTGATRLMSELARFVIDILAESGSTLSEADIISVIQAEEPDFLVPENMTAVTEAIESLVQAELVTVIAQ